ncbi:MAG: hypothetical protein R3C52_08900 [Hyphomonadaceae bacterium]
MLTYSARRTTARFECTTPDGKITREISGYRHQSSFAGRTYAYRIWPPIVHMDPNAPFADTHWAIAREEICEGGQALQFVTLCKPEVWSAVMAIDLQR